MAWLDIPECGEPAPVVPPLADRRAWRAIGPDWTQRLIARGEAALSGCWPQLLASDYAAFVRDGDRVGFETAYFARRRRLNALVMAELAEGRGRFLPQIADGVWLLAEESGWQLPAHNADRRGGARAALPDVTRPIVDLFAAETGAQLALIHQVMGPELDRLMPGLPDRIAREVRARVLAPVLTTDFWWLGKAGGTNNWTAWCAQNVILSALTLPLDRATRRAILSRAAGALQAFWDEYPDDGACEEGALYYRHGALCLWGGLHLLASIVPDQVEALWRQGKMRAMAEFIAAVHVAGPNYINFADCSAVLAPSTRREALFAQATGSDRLRDYAGRTSADHDDLPDEVNLWYRCLQALDRSQATVPAAVPVRDDWYPANGLMVARDDRFVLAAKAGGNGESHNHNDTGSVTLWKDGRPVLVDIGVETYSAKTFSDRRYEIWTMQSGWHNLPSFGGIMQRDGAAFAAADVRADLDPASASLSMQLAGAWPSEARLRSFRRKAMLIRGDGVVIEDHYDGDLPAELSLVLAQPPRMTALGLELDGLCRIEIRGGRDIRVERREILDPRLRDAWPAGLWRVRIRAGAQQPFSARQSLSLRVM